MSDETTSVWADIWAWAKWVGAFVPDAIDRFPVATAWAWPASLIAVWWFL